MNNIKYLFVLDLDGTVLYDFDSISQTLCEYIKEIQKDGHKVVIATGRPYRSSKFVYEAFGLDTPIINYNGSLIHHPLKKDFKAISHLINKDIIFDVFEKNKDYIRNAFSEINDDVYLYRTEKAIEPFLHASNATSMIIGDFDKTIKRDINGMIIIGYEGTGEKIKAYVDENYQGKIKARIWQSAGEYDSIIEIFAPEVNKGNAIEIVGQYLGFDQKDIIAIGDGHNDIEMLKYAGLGVAMKNAHPELLAVADKILEHTPREDAVFRFINNFLDETKL
jgi:Cof subfamily protein (haloacid dehalogenase superfamily)